MKSIVNSQLTGKWYQIAHTFNPKMMMFLDVFIYLSMSCKNTLDLLYVGIKEDRSKVMKKLTLRILTKGGLNYLIVGNMLFRKKLKILTFDVSGGIMIVADKRMKYISILSRKPTVNQDVVESYLSKIDLLKSNIKEIKLYSNSIVELSNH